MKRECQCIKVCGSATLRGRITLPASKSVSNRVLVIDALAGGNGAGLHNLSDCDDVRVMREWLRERPDVIDVGAAGTAMRFSAALLAVTDGVHVLTGSERMKRRPVGVLVDALRCLGASVEYLGEEGFPPLRIEGRKCLRGGSLRLSGSVSSQYVSALLMIGAVLQDGLLIELEGEIVSRPYIDLTLNVMRNFGARAEWVDESSLRVWPTGYKCRNYEVESDWSSASYWYEMVALTNDAFAEVLLHGLRPDSAQGDRGIVELFDRLGVKTEWVEEDGVAAARLTKQAVTVNRMDADLVTMPDMAQTFVVTCCMMDLPFCFRGLQSLRIKETDRLLALRKELAKLGYDVEERNGSELSWDGRHDDSRQYLPVTIDTYVDHRMAMAFAPCSLKLRQLRVNDPMVVSKSYPDFWEDLRSMGFEMTEEK